MSTIVQRLSRNWMRIAPRYLPFADAVSAHLPMSQLLRLSLFQLTVGMAMVLLVGTLNRVLIIELRVPAWLVSMMVALPLLFAPFRTLIGFRSDHHRSALGWRRVPYIWMGTLLQFGGLAIMPFAIIVLSGDTHGPAWIGKAAAALAFALTGAGLQTVQTAGLALATDRAPVQNRPRVVALMYAMLLIGMVTSGCLFGALLRSFSELRLIQVVQGAAVLTLMVNLVALWKQEGRSMTRATVESTPLFANSWRKFLGEARAPRFLLTVGLGTAAFNMQDIILEPYGGEILHLPVGATATLTAILAAGMMVACAVAARRLRRGADPYRLAAWGALTGIFAFAGVILAAPAQSQLLFRAATALIGFGGGLFAVATLAAAMDRERGRDHGLALGAWGGVQALAAGLAIALGGALRDTISAAAQRGYFGEALTGAATGYGAVYQLEIGLLFLTLIALGPLVRIRRPADSASLKALGVMDFPG